MSLLLALTWLFDRLDQDIRLINRALLLHLSRATEVLLNGIDLRWVRVEANSQRKWSRVDVHDWVLVLLVTWHGIRVHRVGWLYGSIYGMATVVTATVARGRSQGKGREEKYESLQLELKSLVENMSCWEETKGTSLASEYLLNTWL